jgi:hypothetical protein
MSKTHVCVPSFLIAVLMLGASSASAQDPSPSNLSANVPAAAGAAAVPATDTSGADLAKKINNPISDLVSVPFQFNWENGIGSPDRTRSSSTSSR